MNDIPATADEATDKTSTTPGSIDGALPTTADGPWEEALSALLDELSKTQAELLETLEQKRLLLTSGDRLGLAELEPTERRLADRLRACQERRQALLASAGAAGLPGADLRTLADSLPGEARQRLRGPVREARARARLLQHQSLANWVIVQRTLLHLSQMIEIVATGGEKPPTYQKSGPSAVGGALMDRAV